MDVYLVEMVERETGEKLELVLRESSCGFFWQKESGEDIPLPPRGSLVEARRELERAYLYTHEIIWPLRAPTRRKQHAMDTVFPVRMHTELLWELRLLAGMSNADTSTMIRLIVTDYLRPGTLPPLEQHIINIAGNIYREKQLSTRENPSLK